MKGRKRRSWKAVHWVSRLFLLFSSQITCPGMFRNGGWAQEHFSLWEVSYENTGTYLQWRHRIWGVVIGSQSVAISSEGFSFHNWYNLVYEWGVIQRNTGGLKVLEADPRAGIPLAQQQNWRILDSQAGRWMLRVSTNPWIRHTYKGF